MLQWTLGKSEVSLMKGFREQLLLPGPGPYCRDAQDPTLKLQSWAWRLHFPALTLTLLFTSKTSRPVFLSSAINQPPHCQLPVDPFFFFQLLLSSCVAFVHLACVHPFPDFQLGEGSDEEFQRTDGRLSLHVTDTLSCLSRMRASVLSHTRNSSSVPQPEPGAQRVLARSESESFLGAFI